MRLKDFKHLSKDISRLDETIVRSSLVKHPSGLHLLASGYEGVHEVESDAGSTMRVIGLLRSMHRHVFVDCGHVLEPAVKEAMDCSDQIIVVTTLSLPTIRRTKRLLEALALRDIRRTRWCGGQSVHERPEGVVERNGRTCWACAWRD